MSDNFKNKGFAQIENLIPSWFAGFLFSNLLLSRSRGKLSEDKQVPGSLAIGSSELCDTLLIELKAKIEKASNLELFPTYSFCRLYENGHELKKHTDRDACEISCTLALGNIGGENAVYVAADKMNETICTREFSDAFIDSERIDHSSTEKVLLSPGDAAVYRGCEMIHWRDRFEGELLGQVFLHYVDKNGPKTEWKYDKKPASHLEYYSPSITVV